MSFLKKAITTITTLSMLAGLASCSAVPAASDDTFKIVASFYPMYVLTLNIAGGIDGVEVTSMSDPNMGCIHDHVFSTEDLKKIEGADVFVENGLELEVFNEEIKNAYPDVKIIEAAADVTDAPADGDEVNGHVWTSIYDYELEIQHVSEELQAIDPAHADQYKANADAYLEKITKLETDYAEVISSLDGKGVLVLDETLPSFCVYAGMDFITVETDHEQEALSAGDIAEIITEMNDKNISIIFIGAGEESQIADAIAEETGAAIITLNTCMTGEENKDAYIDQMSENLKTLTGIY